MVIGCEFALLATVSTTRTSVTVTLWNNKLHYHSHALVVSLTAKRVWNTFKMRLVYEIDDSPLHSSNIIDDSSLHKTLSSNIYKKYEFPPAAYPSIGAIGAISPLKPTKVNLFTMILYNSQNSIRYIRPCCRPLFCHGSVVKCTSSLLQ